jgi:hypothetical protein
MAGHLPAERACHPLSPIGELAAFKEWQIMQWLKTEVDCLTDTEDHSVVVYPDDILIFFRTREDHVKPSSPPTPPTHDREG